MFKSNRFAFVLALAVMSSTAFADEPAAEEAPEGPPLPFHCIDGYSGGPITPMAYMCNAGPKGSTCGMPSAAYTFVNLGSDRLQVVSVSQVVFERVELGYSFQNLHIKDLMNDLRLHQFNLRVNVLPEDSFELPLPAVTAGVHFKYNSEIKKLDGDLFGLLTAAGLDEQWGVDYTLTASKTLPKLAFGRPVILTAGLRLSKAAQLGLLGFGSDCQATVEGSVAVLPIDQLCLAYEFRGKQNGSFMVDEDDWHAFSASYVVNENITVTGLYGNFGQIFLDDANCVWAVQLKYEL